MPSCSQCQAPEQQSCPTLSQCSCWLRSCGLWLQLSQSWLLGGGGQRRTLISCPSCLQPLLFADLLDENCLVVVERPVMDIKTQLPLPVQQKKFGT